MKKTIVLMLALIMVLCFSVPCFALTFSDVSSEAWYAPFVFDLTDKKVINGYTDGTFRPENKVSLGEFLKLIIIASVGDRVNFELITPDFEHWAAPYLKVAENAHVVNKGEYSKADLDREVTRIEIVRILSKCDISILENPQLSSGRAFSDTGSLSEDDAMYLDHAVAIEVINGDPAGTFRPNDGLKRSECAKVIFAFTNR